MKEYNTYSEDAFPEGTGNQELTYATWNTILHKSVQATSGPTSEVNIAQYTGVFYKAVENGEIEPDRNVGRHIVGFGEYSGLTQNFHGSVSISTFRESVEKSKPFEDTGKHALASMGIDLTLLAPDDERIDGFFGVHVGVLEDHSIAYKIMYGGPDDPEVFSQFENSIDTVGLSFNSNDEQLVWEKQSTSYEDDLPWASTEKSGSLTEEQARKFLLALNKFSEPPK